MPLEIGTNLKRRKNYKELAGNDLIQDPVGKKYIATEAGNAAVALGVQSFAKGDLATTVGTRSSANAAAAVALGADAHASQENAVALGAGSTTVTNATKVLKATVGSVVYGDDTGNAFCKHKSPIFLQAEKAFIFTM